MKAAWVMRLTRLPADRNSEFLIWKNSTITIRPMMTGRAPLSPLRIRLNQIRPYSLTDPAIRAGDAAATAASTSGLPGALSVVTPPGSAGGFVDANGQPSGPLSGARTEPSSLRVRCVVPVVIRSTVDAMS